MRNRSFLFLFFFTLSLPCLAQDLVNDLWKIRRKYFQPQGEIKYSVRMLFYDVSNLKQVEDSSHGTFCIAKNKTFADIENLVSITNDSLILVVDKADKKIFISKNFQNDAAKKSSFSILDSIASALNLKIVPLEASSKEFKKFRIHVPEGDVDSADIEYNGTSFLVNSLFIYYKYTIDFDSKVKPVVKIFYYNQKILPYINLDHFDINRYVLIDRKKATVREAYKSYRLINNLIF